MVQKDNVPSALLIIDVQNDFLPKGSLAVPDADAIVQPINDLMKLKGSAFDLIVASQDWHPKVGLPCWFSTADSFALCRNGG